MRSNKKRSDIEEVLNIFDENEIENLLLYSLSPNNTNHENGKAINEKHINFQISDQMNFQEFSTKNSATADFRSLFSEVG